MHLQDGVFGDDTGPDGKIVDQGGPAQPVQQQPVTSIPTMTEWGMFILVILLYMIAIHRARED
ncbi:MAG: hypothetical protein EHM36_08075 [Deltaproteobacteria bacterium]|nr:MAG: hypothetical protein EHM36_08075 [Deltaproteobacteria bacterium]